MRRLTAMLLTLVLLFTLSASAENAAPDPTGRWETSLNETLCATVLTLTPDCRFLMYSEGRATSGDWTLADDSLTLTTHCDSLSGVTVEPLTAVYAFDASASVITIPGGLHLYRSVPEFQGTWVGFPETAASDSIHLFVGGERFVLCYTVMGSDEPELPYGGHWFEGSYWLEGRWSVAEGHYVLTTDQGYVFYLIQSPVTGFLTTEDSHLLYKYD